MIIVTDIGMHDKKSLETTGLEYQLIIISNCGNFLNY
jgi:hypothetical protein